MAHFRALPVMLVFFAASCLADTGAVGIFEAHGDIGDPAKAGNAKFDQASGEYTVTGGGENVWGRKDSFHYVYKRFQGDFTMTADVRFVGEGKNAHRKAMIMVRQDTTPTSIYADAAVHGDGLTSLQYRSINDGMTAEFKSELSKPKRVRLVRRGDTITLYASTDGTNFKGAEPLKMNMHNPVYVGLGVCSHEADVTETAIFSNVTLEAK